MTLSIIKLEKLLSVKGYKANKYLIIDNYCSYVHVTSIYDDTNFLLYIPSKYEFKMQAGKNIYELKDIDLTTSRSTTEEYVGTPDKTKLESDYSEINIDTDPSKNKDITEYLEEGYKRTITLNDISKEDTKEIKDIYRQLTRLGYCVQNIKYKLGILYKNYICVIRRDDSLDCYFIKYLPQKNSRRLYIIIDLELLYDQMDTIQQNMKTVLNGVYKVLNKNQISHLRTLKKFLDEKADILLSTEMAKNKSDEYTSYINELDEMLKTISISESKIIKKINSHQTTHNNTGIKGLHSDIERTHLVARDESELSNVRSIKQDIVRNIEEIRDKRDDTLLNVDKILFDNQVMLHEIIKNFEQLVKL